jgi:hypothetical protein
VQLSDSTSTTSSVLAATPTAVKSAYDLAAAAVPKSTVTTAGDVIYATGSAAVTRLGIGTAGKVLTVNAGATAPEWATAASSGGMTLIATATPSGATSLSFSSIPSTYKHLLLVWLNVYQSSTSQTWSVRLNNDSASVYQHSGMYRVGATIAGADTDDNNLFGGNEQASPITFTASSNANMNRLSRGSMNIYRYTDTGSRLVQWSTTGYKTASTASNVFISAYGTYNPASGSAVSSIDFIRSATQTITGTFYLYGVS